MEADRLASSPGRSSLLSYSEGKAFRHGGTFESHALHLKLPASQATPGALHWPPRAELTPPPPPSHFTDIEDTLAELIKKSGGILGRGSKFGGLDSAFCLLVRRKRSGNADPLPSISALPVKRVYFGNWLRDYSQAMDVAGLSKLSKQTIINLCMALGFLAHGYATGAHDAACAGTSLTHVPR